MDLFGDLPEPTTQEPTVPSRLPTIPTRPLAAPTRLSADSKDLPLYDDLDLSSDPVDLSVSKAIDQRSTDNAPVTKRKSEDEKLSDTAKKKKSAKYVLQSYLAERQGEREDMQDAHLILHDCTRHCPDLHPSIYRLSVYAVFDGHGGTRASRFASENLHKNLLDKLTKGDVTQVERDIKKLLTEAFKKTDEDFLKEAAKHKPVWKDGTTAIMLCLINETLYIGNIGDSQAVLCRYKEDIQACTAVPLSSPHNPSIYEERMRIQKAGGHVTNGRVMGVLEVSRSIGDGQYKKLGVTCVPDIRKCQLTNNDRFVLVACDGLWKCFQPQDSIRFVNEILQDEGIVGTETKTARDVRYETACSKLANEAVLRLSADNVTVMLLSITES